MLPVLLRYLALSLIISWQVCWGGLVVIESIFANENSVQRDLWFEEMLIGDSEYLIDFENLSSGLNIHNLEIEGGLVIRDTTASEVVQITGDPEILGTSNPVGNFAAAHNEGDSLVLDFSIEPVDYVGFFEIDTLGGQYTITFTDGTTESFTTETTASGGNSAEFLGIYRNDCAKITSVSVISIRGDGEWAIDDIEFGNIERVYVDQSAGGQNDGTSWENAFTNLGEAIASSGGQSQFHIAEGVYYPDDFEPAANLRDSRFTLTMAQHLVGGYPAGGGDRNSEIYRTILSGDLDQDDVDGNGDGVIASYEDIVGGNAYRVLELPELESRVFLSGITITAGSATGEEAEESQSVGAGVQSSNRGVLMSRCILVGNESMGNGGGALFSTNDEQSIRIVDSQFSGNFAGSSGAGLSAFTPMARIQNCHFFDNTVDANGDENRGVAFSISGEASLSVPLKRLEIVECMIEDNHVTSDATMAASVGFVSDYASCEIERSSFRGNSTMLLEDDAVLSFRAVSSVRISSSLFSGNRTNSILFGQETVQGPSVMRLTAGNVSIAQNAAERLYGSRDGDLTTFATFLNCYSSSPIGALPDSVSVQVFFSLVSGWNSFSNLALETDPGFIGPRLASEAPTILGDYRLLPTSALVDAGNNSFSSGGFDLAGFARIQDGGLSDELTIDIGAFEHDINSVLQSVEVEISGFLLNPENGSVELTVDASTETSYITQTSSDLTSPENWSNVRSGVLSDGSNVIVLAGEDYGWPQEKLFFRVLHD